MSRSTVLPRSWRQIVITAFMLAASLPAHLALAQVADSAADAASCQCVCTNDAVTDTGDATPATSGDENSEQIAGPNDAIDDSSETAADTTARPMITFSELLPDPEGKDTEGEFIEIHNAGGSDAALAGWSIRSTNEKIFNLPDVIIAAGSHRYFSYAESKIVLTNTGSELSLVDANGSNVDFIAYSGPAKTGQSYAKNGIGQWRWTPLLTPGQANEFPPPETTGTASEESELPPSESPSPDTTANEDGAPATTVPESDSTNAAVPPATDPAAIPSAGDADPPDDSMTTAPLIVISESLPNPVGDDATEWIELANLGGLDAALTGWSVDDDPGGSKPFVLTSADVVPAGGFLLLPKSRSGLALNNDGDSVRLFDAAGVLVDAVAYASAAEGKSYARTRTGWVWTGQPTPGAANEPGIADNQAENPVSAGVALTAPSDDENGAAGDNLTTEIAELAEMDDGDQVTISGLVNIPPGRLGKTLVGLQDQAGTAGVIVRLYGKTLPNMSVGEVWSLSGRLGRTGDALRLNVRVADALMIGGQTLAFQKRSIAEISSEDDGIAVSIAGLAAGHGRNWLTITDADGNGEIRITLPQGAQVGPIETGAAVTASGVVRFAADRPELVVMDKKDLKMTAAPAVDLASGEPAPASEKMAEISRPPLVLMKNMEQVIGRSAWIVVALLIAAAAAAFVWWRRRQFSDGLAE